METSYIKMTNAELQEICDELNLTVTTKASIPVKQELVDAILKFKKEQEEIHSNKEKKYDIPNTATKKELSAIQVMKADLMRKVRVIVHDRQEGQTKDELISVSWGNRAIGGQTDWITLTGEPQYVRVGALNNIKDAKTTIHIPKKNGGVDIQIKNRFVIEYVEPLTKQELDELAVQQKARDAKA